MKTLILGLGNDLLSDDAVGILAVRALRARSLPGLAAAPIDIAEHNSAGLSLLDVLVGYDRVLIVDSIHSGKFAPGTVLEMTLEDLRLIPGMSPHYAGLPEVMDIGRRLGLAMPRELLIFAVEIPECLIIGGGLSGPVAAIVATLADRIASLLQVRDLTRAEISASAPGP